MNTPVTSNPLVTRLRAWQADWKTGAPFGEAADEIERVTRELEHEHSMLIQTSGEYDAMADENDRLRAALTRCADTFNDFNKGLRLLNRPLLADACAIAEADCRNAVEEKPEPRTWRSGLPLGECEHGTFLPHHSCSKCEAENAADEKPEYPSDELSPTSGPQRSKCAHAECWSVCQWTDCHDAKQCLHLKAKTEQSEEDGKHV